MNSFKKVSLLMMILVCFCCQAKAYVSLNDTIKQVYSRGMADSLGIIADSSSVLEKVGNTLDRISNTRFHKIIYTSAPLIVNGLIVKGQNKHFRGLRNDYLPEFDRSLDNYIQFLPAAVMVGLKLGGVEGRSSWGRMLISDAMSIALMAGIVNSLKYSTKVERPDGSDRFSFPSGHTATAFMTATMLAKEYGFRSPWVGIGAYTVASATGLMRMANNKHWLSDVLTGAGIGIVSTELGYYFADLIFKKRGLNAINVQETFEKMQKPTFLSLNFLISLPLGSYPIGKNSEFKVSSGCTSSVEGAYFFNPYIGAGGRFSVTRTSVIVNEVKAENNVFDTWKLSGGAYFSYPLSARWLVGSKLLAERVYYPNLQLTNYLIDSQHGIGFGTGVSLTFRARQRYGVRFLLDYDLLSYRAKGERTCVHSLALGSSFLITF